MTFANYEYLFLLLLLIPYIVWYWRCQRSSTPSLQVSSTESYLRAPKSWRIYLLHLPFLCRLVCIAAAVLALARPQTTNRWTSRDVEGIDIMLSMDVSTSMLAEDLKPNRIEAAKQVAIEFINGRPNDNIGLTLFAGEAFTQCPMTTDHAVLLNLLNGMRVDMAQRGLIDDGTALGMGIANAVTRLKDSKAKSKVIILLTDGTNNCGQISPNTIATKTDGEFYRATNTEKLHEVYAKIDQLEKTKMNVKQYSKRYEAFVPFALVAVLALLLELLLRHTLLRRIP